MSADLYEDFAGRYDLVPGRLDENNPMTVEFFQRVFSKNNVQSVLDCACGTGRHLILFHNLSCKVWGSDVSQAMLDEAHKNLIRSGIKIPMKQADYRNLPQHFSRRFDAVACLGSIGYMPDEIQVLQAFQSMYAVLRKGGILLLTTTPTDRQWKEKPRFKLVVNTSDITRLFVMDYSKRTVGYHILDIYHSQEANELKIWSAKLTVLLKNVQEKILEAVGFRKVDFFGAFDFSPYDKVLSDHLIVVAQK